MESRDLFFLKCCFDRDKSCSPFLVGPYGNLKDAKARATWFQNQASPRKILGVKTLSSEKLSGDHYLINGTRLFNMSHLPKVRWDGSIEEGRAEMVFANDYFSSSGELV